MREGEVWIDPFKERVDAQERIKSMYPNNRQGRRARDRALKRLDEKTLSRE